MPKPPRRHIAKPPRRPRRRPGFGTFAAAFAAAAGGGDAAWSKLRSCLIGWSGGRAEDVPAASLLASLWCGRGAMPPRLGLRAWGFRAFVRDHFPAWPKTRPLPFPSRTAACRLGDAGIGAELADLETLMGSGRAAPSPATRRTIRVLAVGCMGFGHMWRDMGFASRAELRQILLAATPRVAGRNRADMKWKKFLYRELCKSEAGYVCRSPSCDACAGYDDCFGAET